MHCKPRGKTTKIRRHPSFSAPAPTTLVDCGLLTTDSVPVGSAGACVVPDLPGASQGATFSYRCPFEAPAAPSLCPVSLPFFFYLFFSPTIHISLSFSKRSHEPSSFSLLSFSPSRSIHVLFHFCLLFFFASSALLTRCTSSSIFVFCSFLPQPF